LDNERHICAGVPSNSRPQPSENSVSAQNRALGEPVADVARSVARRFEHLGLRVAELKPVALGQAEIDARDARRVGLWPGDPTAGRLLQLEVAAGMVCVMVGGEDPIQPPALRAQPLEHRRGDPGVDHRGHPRLRLVQQIDVIVAERRDLLDL
jgi:hypothetical protein